MGPIILNYDSNIHNENRQMKGVYSGVDDAAIYIIYIRSETRCFIDIVYTIDDNVIYEGKKKKGFDILTDSTCNYMLLYHNNYKIYLINVNNNDNINDNNNNLDAIKL